MRRYWAFVVTVIVLFLSYGASGNPTDTDERFARSRPFRIENKFCIYDRVTAGPDGHQLAVWFNDARNLLGERSMLPPTQLIVGRIYGPGESKRDALHIYGGSGLRLFPIRWSRTGTKLYVRVREPQQRIIAIDASGFQLEESTLPPEWSAMDINAITHGDLRLLRAPSVLERVRRVDGKEFIRGSLTLGSTAVVLGARRSDLELVRLDQDRASDLGINSGHTRLLTAFPDKRLYAGGFSYLGATRRVAGENYFPYQLPLIDLESGLVAGRFGPTQILLDSVSPLQSGIDELNRRLRSAGAILLDASLSGDALMALLAFHNGNRHIIRVGREGLTEKLICKRRPVANLQGLRVFRIDDQGRETMTAKGFPIVVQYSAASAVVGSRDAVVDLHGGPGGTLADDVYWLPQSLKLLRPGRDVIAVEYAGSLGGGASLTRRLAKDGMNALRQDAHALAAWLSKQGYEKLYLLAGSFGSVPAMILQSKHRNLICASFHIGPVLALQNPKVWAKTGDGIQSANAGTQLAYEFASFGGKQKRKRFAAELETVVANAELSESYHLYFGEIDNISRPEHLPANAKPKIIIFPLTGHAVLGARSELWRDIESHINCGNSTSIHRRQYY